MATLRASHPFFGPFTTAVIASLPSEGNSFTMSKEGRGATHHEWFDPSTGSGLTMNLLKRGGSGRELRVRGVYSGL